MLSTEASGTTGRDSTTADDDSLTLEVEESNNKSTARREVGGASESKDEELLFELSDVSATESASVSLARLVGRRG